jgi:hypothetical protein
MCSYATFKVPASGAARGPNGWFALGETVVYFDHPQEGPDDHAVCLDFRATSALGDPSARLAVELDPASARRLADSLLAVLEHPDAPPSGMP